MVVLPPLLVAACLVIACDWLVGECLWDEQMFELSVVRAAASHQMCVSALPGMNRCVHALHWGSKTLCRCYH